MYREIIRFSYQMGEEFKTQNLKFKKCGYRILKL